MDAHPLVTAVDMNLRRRKIDGYVLAAEALLAQAEVEKRELADLEDIWDAMHDADRELDRPRRKIRKLTHG